MELFDDSAPEAYGMVFVAEDLLPVWDSFPFGNEFFPHVEVALSSLGLGRMIATCVWGEIRSFTGHEITCDSE